MAQTTEWLDGVRDEWRNEGRRNYKLACKPEPKPEPAPQQQPTTQLPCARRGVLPRPGPAALDDHPSRPPLVLWPLGDVDRRRGGVWPVHRPGGLPADRSFGKRPAGVFPRGHRRPLARSVWPMIGSQQLLFFRGLGPPAGPAANTDSGCDATAHYLSGINHCPPGLTTTISPGLTTTISPCLPLPLRV